MEAHPLSAASGELVVSEERVALPDGESDVSWGGGVVSSVLSVVVSAISLNTGISAASPVKVSPFPSVRLSL